METVPIGTNSIGFPAMLDASKLSLMVAMAFAAIQAAPSVAVAADELVGRAIVLSADTIEVAGLRVRLDGIRVPYPGQQCRIRDRAHDCGKIAADALRDLTTGASVRCIRRGETAPGEVRATCFADGYDLSEGMVYTGWAAAEPRRGKRYLRLEHEARVAGRGLWRGDFAAE